MSIRVSGETIVSRLFAVGSFLECLKKGGSTSVRFSMMARYTDSRKPRNWLLGPKVSTVARYLVVERG